MIAKTLVALRKLHNLTQRQVSKEAPVNRAYLRELESGRSSPTVATLNRILRLFGYQTVIVSRLEAMKNGHCRPVLVKENRCLGDGDCFWIEPKTYGEIVGGETLMVLEEHCQAHDQIRKQYWRIDADS